jgi:Skp family chaperone for outer membrane proteins
MTYKDLMIIVATAAALTTAACDRSEPAAGTTEPDRSADAVQERTEKTAELEKRTIDIEREWTEMESKVKEGARTPTGGLRAEVKEDVANVREAVADLKTTSQENWWERHERALEQTADDIRADVMRLAKRKTLPEPETKAEPVGTSGFDQRRSQFIDRLRARVDGMEEALQNVKADGALDTEIEDTRARIDKLQGDLDNLRNVSQDDWWDVSSERVGEYIDRVERSISRLDDDRAAGSARPQ